MSSTVPALFLFAFANTAAATRASGQSVSPPRGGDTVVVRASDLPRRLLQRDLQFLEDRQGEVIARGALRQATLWPFNPDLSLVSRAAPDGRSGSVLEATLMQEVEIAGQRGLRRRSASESLTRALADVDDAARRVIRDETLRFLDAFVAERRLDVLREGLRLTTQLLDAVHVQVSEGEISTLEATLAEIELGRARARVLEGERLAIAALRPVRQALALSATVAVRLEDATPMVSTPDAVVPVDGDSLLRTALASRPDLEAAHAAVSALESATALARREAWPNLRIGAFAEQVPGTTRLRVGPAVGASLPLWNRNQGTVDQRQAQLAQARLSLRAADARVRNDVAAALDGYRAACREAGVYASMVRQPARTNAALLDTAFRAGKVALPTLLLLRNQLLDAELGYWNAWLACRTAVVQLDAATGSLAREALKTTARSTTIPDTTR